MTTPLYRQVAPAVLRLQRQGYTQAQICEELHIGRDTCRRALRVYRRAIGPNREGRPRLPQADAAETVRLYVEERLSTHEIARRLGIAPVSVWKRLRLAGVPLRSKAEAGLARYERRRAA